MKIDFRKVFVPGIIDYSNRFVEAFKAHITKLGGIKNSDNEVILNFSSVASIEKKKFATGVYGDGPVYEYWKVYMKDRQTYEFEFKTGLAIVMLWKRHTREGRWDMQEDKKINKKIFEN
jgi:hypothetical protein